MPAEMTAVLSSLLRTTAWRNRSSAMTMAALLSVIIACSAEPQVQEVEVTREVPVTQEVPVTVETVQTVQVTREVPVTQEIPVTVETVQTVQVTREVKTVKTVEVTREVPVTRIVSATPVPETPGTSVESPTATPAPTLAPVPAVAMATPTATPASETASQRFGSWEMSESTQYGRSLFYFRNTAVEWEASPEPPTLTYQCYRGGGRSLYIDWGRPLFLTTKVEWVESARQHGVDPFNPRLDYDVTVLVDLADRLLTFVNEADLTRRDKRKRDEIWTEMLDQWGPEKLAETPVGLIDRVDAFLYGVLISLNFFLEKADWDKSLPYEPPFLDNITSKWYVISKQQTRMTAQAAGELKRAYRSYPREEAGARVMTATVWEQPTMVVAKWEISGIDDVMSYCATKR